VGSDRARISFDKSRGYRSVVAQQGRVTLEADVNEQAMIAGEALRKETIDVVGNAGTPDNGYQVSIDANNNLMIGPGIMYLGGWRLRLPTAVNFASQPEWLDMPALPPPATPTAPGGNVVVALLAIEQSISATEDQALLEVALGGPDTAARTRLMQHIVEIPTSASQCPAALKDITAALQKMGLILHPNTLALDFNASLEVSFYPPTVQSDPCCPPAQGGYLGSDNQLVQVTVSSLSPPTLLWGWNNASFLYRATRVSATVLQLATPPIDAAHTPQPGQVIEVLQTTMVLGNASDDNYVAAPQGMVITLGTGTVYDPTSQQITCPTGTVLPTDPNMLFVRLWQAQVQFTSGTAAQLDSVSGLQVTVSISALPTAPLIARPFWSFAVRPNTPQQVYPARYLEGAQPPDGPRQWLCDLAVLTPGAPQGPVEPDCRNTFQPLIDLGTCECCELSLSPTDNWVGKLNDALATDTGRFNICFQPGEFTVTSKITFSSKIVKITGAGAGSVLVGNLEAVLEFDNCPSVILTDLSVDARASGYLAAQGLQNLQGAVTARNCTNVNVERVWLSCFGNDLRSASCLYVYNAPPDTTARVAAFSATPQLTNVRVLNSQFNVGNSQVGILLVNAGRAQVEGNLITTPRTVLGYTLKDLASHRYVESGMLKLLVHQMTVVDTAAPTKKKKKKAAAKKQTPPKPAEPPPPAPSTPAAGTPTPPAAATPAPPATSASTRAATTVPKVLTKVNLGAVGRGHVNSTFGTVQLQFVTSAKLTNAWTDAIKKAGLNASSGVGAVHLAVKTIAASIMKKTETVTPAFRNYVQNLLPQLFSTSSQGIVVGGNLATDIRIMNNTVEGTVQGIHVGLSDMKASPPLTDLQPAQVQICGNSVTVSLTPQTTLDRHGIYLSNAYSAIVDDNNITLTRTEDAAEDISALEVLGDLGPRILIERNFVGGSFTYGIVAQPRAGSDTDLTLWKAADNWSTPSNNISTSFINVNNVPN
jgi:uncharacterized protein DUF6519